MAASIHAWSSRVAVGIASGCAVEGEIGRECDLAVVTEVMTAGESLRDDPVVQSESDFVELYNPTERELDLRGYGFGRAGTEPEDRLDEHLRLAPGERAVVVLSTVVDVCVGPTCPPVIVFDVNNDFDEINLYAPDHDLREPCQHVAVPDQHWQFSWSLTVDEPQPTDGLGDTWCDTAPTPGAPNLPCLCATSDAC